MIDMDPIPINNSKAETLRRVILPKITTAIGRSPDPAETRALAFVVEKKGPETFAIEDGLPPREAAWRIRNIVYQTKIEELDSRMSDSLSNPQELGILRAQKTLFENMQKKAQEGYESGEEKVYLGGVPDHWLPDWAKQM